MGSTTAGNSGRSGAPTLFVRLPLTRFLLGWLGRLFGGAVAVLFRHPGSLFGIVSSAAAGGLLVRKASPLVVVAALFALVSLLGLWRAVGERSFHRCVAWPLRSARRQSRVYRRRWAQAMVATGLAVHMDGVRHLPRLVRVRSTGSIDLVSVAALTGQLLEDFAAVGDRLAQAFGAQECRVKADPRHADRLVLSFLIRDPLAVAVAPFAAADPPELMALPLARQEDEMVYGLRLLGTHLLLVGATGAGKSSVVWAMIHSLAPGISAGLVALWVIDPKGGMELAAGRRLYARFCYGDSGADDSQDIGYAELLEDAVAVMRDRQAKLRGVTRLHQPSADDPLIVVVIDELAALTSYVMDRDAKKRVGSALSLLLSQGRAVGVTVVAALQDPRKEVLPARDLFPTRIGLRMVEAEQVDMVLGAGARARGARCDRIPESLAGVGYVAVDGVNEAVRVRFSFVTDSDIQATVEQHNTRLEVDDVVPQPPSEPDETATEPCVVVGGSAT